MQIPGLASAAQDHYSLVLLLNQHLLEPYIHQALFWVPELEQRAKHVVLPSWNFIPTEGRCTHN